MTETMHPRRPWLALLMSLALPGFGQLYNGEVNKAIWWFCGFAALTVVYALIALWLPSAAVVPAMALGLLATLVLWGWGMVDAWRGAGQRPHWRLRPWQSSGLYLLTLLIAAGLVLPTLIQQVRGHLAESFRIPSASMAPSVLSGDILVADKRYNCPGCKHAVRRGDIAIFTYPNDRTQNYIKRIIALPGDRVQIQGRAIIVNGRNTQLGQALEGDVLRVTEGDGERQWIVQWAAGTVPPIAAELTVPAGHVLVLGDNRSQTRDSRDFGAVPLADVIGRAHQVWFSKGAEGVRWDRMGLVLR